MFLQRHDLRGFGQEPPNDFQLKGTQMFLQRHDLRGFGQEPPNDFQRMMEQAAAVPRPPKPTTPPQPGYEWVMESKFGKGMTSYYWVQKPKAVVGTNPPPAAAIAPRPAAMVVVPQKKRFPTAMVVGLSALVLGLGVYLLTSK